MHLQEAPFQFFIIFINASKLSEDFMWKESESQILGR